MAVDGQPETEVNSPPVKAKRDFDADLGVAWGQGVL